MKKIPIIALVLLTGLVMALHAQTALSPDSVPRMSIEELKQQIDKPNLAFIDVRTSHDWEDSTTKIKGSIREDGSKAAGRPGSRQSILLIQRSNACLPPETRVRSTIFFGYVALFSLGRARGDIRRHICGNDVPT
jgi:hypothetical protein